MFNGTVDVSRRYASNGLNQYVTVTSGGQAVSFANDANGNLRSDGTMCLDYDVENRLLQKRAPAANCDTATAVQASLRYDPLGRLLEVAAAGRRHGSSTMATSFWSNTTPPAPSCAAMSMGPGADHTFAVRRRP